MSYPARAEGLVNMLIYFLVSSSSSLNYSHCPNGKFCIIFRLYIRIKATKTWPTQFNSVSVTLFLCLILPLGWWNRYFSWNLYVVRQNKSEWESEGDCIVADVTVKVRVVAHNLFRYTLGALISKFLYRVCILVVFRSFSPLRQRSFSGSILWAPYK